MNEIITLLRGKREREREIERERFWELQENFVECGNTPTLGINLIMFWWGESVIPMRRYLIPYKIIPEFENNSIILA